MERFQNMNQWKGHLDQFFGSHFWNDIDHLIEPRIPAIAIYEKEKKLTHICYFARYKGS